MIFDLKFLPHVILEILDIVVLFLCPVSDRLVPHSVDVQWCSKQYHCAHVVDCGVLQADISVEENAEIAPHLLSLHGSHQCHLELLFWDVFQIGQGLLKDHGDDAECRDEARLTVALSLDFAVFAKLWSNAILIVENLRKASLLKLIGTLELLL